MALLVTLKVVPNSSRSGCVLDKSGMLKCHVKSPAEDGKANKELIKNLAKVLGVAQEKVTILSGLTQRNKRLKIDVDISMQKLLSLLEIQTPQEQQLNLFK